MSDRAKRGSEEVLQAPAHHTSGLRRLVYARAEVLPRIPARLLWAYGLVTYPRNPAACFTNLALLLLRARRQLVA